MRILCLQHDPLDGPGALLEWAEAGAHKVTFCLICKEEPLPPLESFDLLVSLGGPMGAYEEEKHPWLAEEKQYLRKALSGGKKILGLCLGAQLLADALGGRAFRHTCKEFGWQPIEPTEAGRAWFGASDPFNAFEKHEKGIFYALESHKKGLFQAFQWHGDTYTLPPGAVQLARNEAAEQQAFLIEAPSGGKVLGLQFHLEWTEKMAREALADPDAAPERSPFVQTSEEILSDLILFDLAKKRFFALLNKFTES
jgi:GMP synthase-like glutamine amidotransferase